MSFLYVDQQKYDHWDLSISYRWVRAELQKCQIFLLRVRHKECSSHTEFRPLLGY